jgi:hypothetical protein
MPSFGASIAARTPSNNKSMLLIAGGGIVIAAFAVLLVVLFTKKDEAPAAVDKKDQPIAESNNNAAQQAPQNPQNPPPLPPAVGDQNTGFDLYVSPAVTQWHLDGDLRTDRLPSRIRGIAPGVHTVAIDAPPGFVGGSQQIPVELGKSQKVEITLSPIENLTGRFESTPSDATVSLIIDGKRHVLGPSPATAKLDPRISYQVLFEKAGYVSVNRPVVFTGSTEEKIVINLEKASSIAVDNHVVRPPPPVTQPVTHPDRIDRTPTPPVDKGTPSSDKGANVQPDKGTTPPDKGTTPPDKGATPADKGTTPADKGTLRVGSKPPCQVFIDGADSGVQTPHPFQLPAGKHRITLVNNEYGIKETFWVDIKADQQEMVRKDYSDRLPK